MTEEYHRLRDRAAELRAEAARVDREADQAQLTRADVQNLTPEESEDARRRGALRDLMRGENQ